MNAGMLTIELADKDGLAWAQAQVKSHHYLHASVHPYARPVAYLVMLQGQRVGCLIFGRPEATSCRGWYGSVADVAAGRCPRTRWQVLNLARVWLDPELQPGGGWYDPNWLPGFYDRKGIWRSRAASFLIDLALERVVFDYLLLRPPVWLDEPYQICEVLSYCDTRRHRGTLYHVSCFALARTNAEGIETYRRAVRALTPEECAVIARRSQEDPRCRKLRAMRQSAAYTQLQFNTNHLQEEGA